MQAETTEDAEGDDSAHCSHCTGSAAAELKKVQTDFMSLGHQGTPHRKILSL